MPMNINLAHTTRLLQRLMETTENDIVSRFAGLPGARMIPCPSSGTDAVFIPGTRPDRVLLVAHYDTVWTADTIETCIEGTRIESNKASVGCGADNRAGCAALWMLRKSGHSLLIVPDEEIGGIGSGDVASNKEWLPTLRDHTFMIQFDRRGAFDFVTYDCDNPKFNRWMLDRLPGYAATSGSFSDITELMPALGIAGCNLSIGFRNEHTRFESLDILDFIRTVENVRAILAEPCKRFKFITTPPPAPRKGRARGTGKNDKISWSFPAKPMKQTPISVSAKYENNDPYWCNDCSSAFDADDMRIWVDETCPNCRGKLERWSEEEVKYPQQPTGDMCGLDWIESLDLDNLSDDEARILIEKGWA